MEFTRINNDINGNPRYVVHYTALLTDKEQRYSDGEQYHHGTVSLMNRYGVAVKRANKIGGRKYHTKSYGGGIVFQSYNTNQLRKQIEQLRNEG